MKKLAMCIALILMAACLGACGFGSIKTEMTPQQGPAERCEAHFVSLFKNYTEIGGNACNASVNAAGSKVDTSMAMAVTSLAALAGKLAAGQ